MRARQKKRIPGRWRRVFRAWKKTIGKSLIVLLLASAAIHIASSPKFLFLERHLLSILFEIRGAFNPISSPQDLLIVAVDDASYSQLGISSIKPVPREIYVALLKRFDLAGAKRVILDVVFDQHSNFPEVDRELSEAIGRLPVTIGKMHLIDSYTNELGEHVQKVNVLEPHPLIAKNAQYIVSMLVKLDSDSVVRGFWVKDKEGKIIAPPLAAPLFDSDVKGMNFPGDRDLILFYGPPGSISTMPLYKVLKSDIQDLKKIIAGKTVVVGHRDPMRADQPQDDEYMTSVGRTYGVEIHASVLGNLIDKKWLKRVDPVIERTASALLVVWMSFLFITTRVSRGSIILLVFVVVVAITTYVSFCFNYFVASFAHIVLFVPLILIGGFGTHYFYSMRALKEIEDSLGVRLKPPT